MSYFARIRAVSFDAGGTLVEVQPSVGHVYAQVAAKFGLTNLDPAAITHEFGRVWKEKTEFDYSPPAWFEIVRQAFGARATELPPEFFPAVYERFAEQDVWRIHEDVLPTLDALASQDIPLAIVSNWDERLRPLLGRLGLQSYFQTIVVSREVAFYKPSPVIFEMAIRRLGLPAEEILHVGDHFAEDVEAARVAGLQAVQLDRSAHGSGPHHISSLLQLPALVENAACGLLTVGAGD